jgi:hypothetical protein
MSRILNIEPREGALPWRAHPSAETTIAELERAVHELDLDILKTNTDEILLVQTEKQIRDGVPPPMTDELAEVMFGVDSVVTTVEESGTYPIITPGGAI